MSLQALGLQALATIGLYALNEYLKDQPPKPKKPNAAGIEHAQNTIGSPMPIVYGMVRIDNPVLIWHGNRFADIAASGNPVYRIDLLLNLGVTAWDEPAAPWNSWRVSNPPTVRKIFYGDESTILTGTLWVGVSGGQSPPPSTIEAPYGLAHGQSARINPGGDNRAATVRMSAKVEFFDGRRDQAITNYPANGITDPTYRIDQAIVAHNVIDRALMPGYRNQMLLAVLMSETSKNLAENWGRHDGAGGSVDSHLATFGVEVWAAGPQPIGGFGIDANPAWVIFDLLCGKVWKLGHDVEQMDLASFQAAANTLAAEEHGCSLVIYESQSVAEIVQSLLHQIDAVLYENLETGLVTLKLIRNDYDANAIPTMTVDNTIGRPTVNALGWGDTPNQVRVRFSNRNRGYKTDSTSAQRISRNGQRLRSIDSDVPYCTTEAVAQKIAARELAQVGRPLMAVNAALNREFYAVNIGDAVKANWPQLGIINKIFRVIAVDRGQPSENKITLGLIEDVFGVTIGAFTPPPVFVPEIPDVYPITERIFTWAPRWLVQRAFEEGLVPNASSEYVMDLAVASSGASQVSTETRRAGKHNPLTNEWSVDVPRRNFPRTAKLAIALARELEPYDTTTGLVIGTIGGHGASSLASEDPVTNTDIADSGANLILVGEEIMAYESVTDLGGGQVLLNNVWRGLLDTAPVAHPIGTRVFWLSTAAVGRKPWTAGGFLPVGRDVSHGNAR